MPANNQLIVWQKT